MAVNRNVKRKPTRQEGSNFSNGPRSPRNFQGNFPQLVSQNAIFSVVNVIVLVELKKMGLYNFLSITYFKQKTEPGTVTLSQNNIQPTDVTLL